MFFSKNNCPNPIFIKVKNMDETNLFSGNSFEKVNEIYAQYFRSLPPARETVQVSKLPKDVDVEISCIAVK